MTVQEQAEKFWAVYERKWREASAGDSQMYSAVGPKRMQRAFAAGNPNTDTIIFEATCKELGIAPNHEAMAAYIGVEA